MEQEFKRFWASEKVRNLAPMSKEKSTLVALAEYADPDGSNAFPSIPTLARCTGHSERTVQRHLRLLEQRGELVVQSRSLGGRKRTVYRIPCCQLSPAPFVREHREAPEQVELLEISGVDLSPEGCPVVTGAVTDCHPTNPISTHHQSLGLVLKKREQKKFDPASDPVEKYRWRPQAPRSPETEAMIQAAKDAIEEAIRADGADLFDPTLPRKRRLGSLVSVFGDDVAAYG
jgi:Helix-turn-helix domain